MNYTLNELVPGSISVRTGDETIDIRPFTFGQLPRVLRHIGDVLGCLTGDTLDLSTLSEPAAESIIALAMIAANKPRDWFDQLPPDEGIALLRAVIEVNRDFFARRVGPEVERLRLTLSSITSTSSTGSSLPATATAKSSATASDKSGSSIAPH